MSSEYQQRYNHLHHHGTTTAGSRSSPPASPNVIDSIVAASAATIYDDVDEFMANQTGLYDDVTGSEFEDDDVEELNNDAVALAVKQAAQKVASVAIKLGVSTAPLLPALSPAPSLPVLPTPKPMPAITTALSPIKTTTTTANTTANRTTNITTKKKRGRPLGSKNKIVAKGTAAEKAIAAENNVSKGLVAADTVPGTKKRGLPPKKIAGKNGGTTTTTTTTSSSKNTKKKNKVEALTPPAILGTTLVSGTKARSISIAPSPSARTHRPAGPPQEATSIRPGGGGPVAIAPGLTGQGGPVALAAAIAASASSRPRSSSSGSAMAVTWRKEHQLQQHSLAKTNNTAQPKSATETGPTSSAESLTKEGKTKRGTELIAMIEKTKLANRAKPPPKIIPPDVPLGGKNAPNEPWPSGWYSQSFVRQSGNSAGTTDKYFFSPKKNYKFRSLKEVRLFLLGVQQYGGGTTAIGNGGDNDNATNMDGKDEEYALKYMRAMKKCKGNEQEAKILLAEAVHKQQSQRMKLSITNSPSTMMQNSNSTNNSGATPQKKKKTNDKNGGGGSTPSFTPNNKDDDTETEDETESRTPRAATNITEI